MSNNPRPAPDGMKERLARPVQWVLGLPFDAVTLDSAVGRISDAVRHRRRLFISTPNLNFLIASQSNSSFQNSVLNSDLSVADGMPIVWIARLLGVPIPGRVAGSDIFEALMRGGAGPMKVFFFGGEEGVAAEAAERIAARKGPLSCAGCHSPGFGPVEQMSSPDIIADINASGADFIVVALGAIKGQAWIELNREKLSAPVISHLGAVVNFAAGTVSRAPRWMQKAGMEWLWRIKEEPKLLKRYFDDGWALAELFFRNMLPLILMRRRQARELPAVSAIEISTGGEKVRMVFKAVRPTAGRLASRTDIAERMKRARDVEIFVEDAVQLDPSLLGMIFLIRREAARAGLGYRVTLDGPVCRLNRELEWHRAVELLEPFPRLTKSG